MEPQRHEKPLKNPLANSLLAFHGNGGSDDDDSNRCVGCRPELVAGIVYAAGDFAKLYICQNCQRQLRERRSSRLH